MSNSNEWLFDVLVELSDKSHDAGLAEVAGKLEEALDVLLAAKYPLRPKIKLIRNGPNKLIVKVDSDAQRIAPPDRPKTVKSRNRSRFWDRRKTGLRRPLQFSGAYASRELSQI